MKKVLLFTYILICFSVTAQVTNDGYPKSWSMSKKELTNLKSIKLPSFDLKKLEAEDKVNDKNKAKPWRFGYKHKVNYGIDNSGEWIETENGDKVWRVLFESKGALSLNFIFDKFYMPKGAKVYIYSDDRKDLLGAYTEVQNQESEKLGTWLVEGDKVWVEYFEPKEVRGQGKLNISTITHRYRTKSTNDAKVLGDSGDCNHDVDCSIGADFEEHKNRNKNAVVLILNNGGDWCTGTLINNTNYDKRPLVLTANHCLNGNSENWSFRFGWISPNPSCGTTDDSTDGPKNMTISGAVVRASNSNSDMALVELNSDIPNEWNRVWAGWDRSDIAPSFTVGIHHPAGDIMKVSRDNDPPVKIAQNAGGSSEVAQTWDITGLTDNGNSGTETGWEIGVTEGGSSGSALFDPNGRIIGQLYGGGAACSGTDDNNNHDYYGRFGVSWDAGGTPETQLKDWLDPKGIAPVTLDPLPAPQIFALDGSASSRVPETECGVYEVTPKIVVRNAGSTNLTSLKIQWNIDGGSTNEIDWTGSLSQEQTEELTLPTINVEPGNHTITVSTFNPNGSNDQNTSNDYSVNNFSIQGSYNTSEIKMKLLTDDFSDETSWSFKDANGNVIASGGPYNGESDDNTEFTETFTVSLDNCYTFTISDSESDGICCGFGNGRYSLETADGTIIKEGASFGGGETTSIRIDNKLSTDDDVLKKNIVLYPNPSKGILNVNVSNEIGKLTYNVYNVLGQNLKSGVIENNNPINLSSLPNNVYLVRIIDVERNATLTKKIVLNK